MEIVAPGLAESLVPMSYEIYWRIWLRVKSEEKARGRLDRVSELFGVPMTTTTCEKYWKTPGLLVFAFATNAHGDSIRRSICGLTGDGSMDQSRRDVLPLPTTHYPLPTS